MKGFFKRDLYLMLVGAKFYLAFILVLGVLLFINKTAMSFVSLYVMIFLASTLLSLFNYDEQNGWGAYAAAVPDGRRAQVDGRYLVALVVTLAAVALQGMVCLLSGGEGWEMVLLYAGMLLVYIALLFPLAYRFGNKSRLIMIILIAVVAGAIGVGGSIGIMAGGPGAKAPSFTAVGAVLLAIGAVAVVVSHRVSVAIVKRLEW